MAHLSWAMCYDRSYFKTLIPKYASTAMLASLFRLRHRDFGNSGESIKRKRKWKMEWKLGLYWGL